MGYKRKLFTAAYRRAGPKVRMAFRNYKKGRTFYKKNKGSFRKAGRILRRGLSRQKQIMKTVGDTPYKKSCKVYQITNDSAGVGPVNRSARTLYSSNLIARIPKQTGADEINLRDSDVIEVKGVKIDYLFMAINNLVCVVNMALVIPKDMAALALTVPTTSFFRAYGTALEQDFTTQLTGHDMTNRGINPDRYDILWRKKFILSHFEEPNPDAGPHATMPNAKFYKRIKQYIPVNRQFRVYSLQETQGHDPWLVYWIDFIGAPANTPVTPDIVATEEIVRIYFNDHQL